MKGEEHSTRPLSKIDTAWLRMDEPTNRMMITIVLMFDEPLEHDHVRATIEHWLLRHSRFVQRVGGPLLPFGSPRWETDPHFDLRAHLHRVALPAPGDQKALQDLVSDLMSTSLDHEKPLWQVHVVEGVGSGSAFVMRLHHCIGDGVSLAELFREITEDGPAEHRSPHHRDEHKHLAGRITALGNVVHAASEVVKRAVDAWNEPEHARHLAHQGAAAASAHASSPK